LAGAGQEHGERPVFVLPGRQRLHPQYHTEGTGLASWSQKDIVYALETGFTPEGDALGGSMANVQKNMARLTPEDREAIAPISSQFRRLRMSVRRRSRLKASLVRQGLCLYAYDRSNPTSPIRPPWLLKSGFCGKKAQINQREHRQKRLRCRPAPLPAL
jgi:hypothetical protein